MWLHLTRIVIASLTLLLGLWPASAYADACVNEQSFYGVSLDRIVGGEHSGGLGYVYRQSDGIVTEKRIFLRVGRRGYHVVQLDTFPRDDDQSFWVDSRLESLDDGKWTYTGLQFRGAGWREWLLTPRVPNWHLWQLDVGLSDDAEPFCRLNFLVFFDVDEDIR